MGRRSLWPVHSMRDLEDVVDSKPNFSDHIDATVKRGNRALGILIHSLLQSTRPWCCGSILCKRALYSKIR